MPKRKLSIETDCKSRTATINFLKNCGLSLKSDQKVLKKWSTTFTQKITHNCLSKIRLQMVLKIDPQLLLKKWSTNVTQKWPTTVTQKLTDEHYSILSKEHGTFLINKHGIQKCSKPLTLSWLFFDWKIAVASYKKKKN